MASEYLKKKGIPQDPLRPLNFRRKKAKGETENEPEKNSEED